MIFCRYTDRGPKRLDGESDTRPVDTLYAFDGATEFNNWREIFVKTTRSRKTPRIEQIWNSDNGDVVRIKL